MNNFFHNNGFNIINNNEFEKIIYDQNNNLYRTIKYFIYYNENYNLFSLTGLIMINANVIIDNFNIIFENFNDIIVNNNLILN